jgi:hypothetical protein
MRAPSSIRGMSLVSILVVMQTSGALADKRILDKNSCGPFGSGDRLIISVNESPVHALADKRKIRLVFVSGKSQNRQLHELRSNTTVALNSPGSAQADYETTSQQSNATLQLVYQGFLGQWYTLSIEGTTSYELTDLPWGSVVTIEWLLPQCH